MPTDIGPSIIRTVVPLLVSLLGGILTRKGIDPGPYADLISQIVGAVVGTVYYTVARWLETHVKPRFGWLLGLPKAPTYDSTAVQNPASPTGESAGPASTLPPETPVETVPVDPDTANGSTV